MDSVDAFVKTLGVLSIVLVLVGCVVGGVLLATQTGVLTLG